eukprot:SAG11_NODE_3712_length_2266_cov_16.035072_4_plen_172_part_00
MAASGPGYVPVNEACRLGKRPAFQQPGHRTDPRLWSDLEWSQAYPLWDRVKPGTEKNRHGGTPVVSQRDKNELKALGPSVDALGDVLGYLSGDAAGRIDTALPTLKAIFENLATRRGTLEAGALGDMGYISTDKAISASGASAAIVFVVAALEHRDVVNPSERLDIAERAG